MIRLGIALGLIALTIWVAGFITIMLFATARMIFDPDQSLPKDITRGQLFIGRFAVAMIWWLMLFSPYGRDMIIYLLTGRITGRITELEEEE